MKKIICFLALMFLSLALLACDNEKVENKKLSIEENVEIKVGEECTLNPVVEGIDNPEYVWIIGDESLVSISNNIIKGLKEGKTTISLTETNSGLQVYVEVTVKKDMVNTKNLTIEGENKCKVGDTITLNAKYDNDATVALIWSTSDEGIAIIQSSGTRCVITGVKKGNVTITVKDNKSNLTSSINVTIESDVITIDDMLDWAFSVSGTESLDEVELPTKNDETGATFVWSTDKPELLDIEEGYVKLVEVDEKIKLTCVATFNGETKERTIDFTVLGYAVYDVYDEFMKQFKGNNIYRDMTEIEKAYSMYGGSTVEMESHNKDIFDNNGKLTKSFYDEKVNVTLHITLTNPAVQKDIDVVLTAKAMDGDERKATVKNWVEKNLFPDGYIYKTTVLPSHIDDYDVNLEWLNPNGGTFKVEFSVDNPILGDNIGLLVKFTTKDGVKYNFELSCKAAITPITDPWQKIDLFVNTIADSEVTAFSYLVINWTSYSTGYVPFITAGDLPVIEDILSYTDGKNRTGITKTSTEYVVVHDTGSPSSGADATMHNNYIKNLNYSTDPDKRVVSWHFTVDDKLCYQHLPLDEVAWHAGDGSHRYGDVYKNTTYNKTDCIGGGNYNGIGIESCVNNGTDYTYTMRRLAKLVASLLVKYHLGIDRVKQHWHFSGKNCPQVMRESNRWNELIYLIKLEYYLMTELKGATLEWTSLTPDIMDNEGRVIGKQPSGTTLSYKVKVTYEGTSKEYTFSSVLKTR